MATVGASTTSQRTASSARDCAAFFTTDVQQFLAWLDETERRMTADRELAATPALRQEVDERWSRIIDRGEEAVSQLRKPVDKKAVKDAFRAAVRPWISGNPFIERALAKPRGYPGDYLMMERFYGGQHELSGGLAGVLDRFLLDHYACVINRKNRSKLDIRRHVARLAPTGAPIRIVTLGAGPCREWFELDQELDAAERRGFANVELTVLDQDEEALEFCRARFTKSRLIRSAEFVRSSLLGFTKSERWMHQSGTFDLVYAFGIADYFHDEMLSSIVTSAFSLVKEEGEVTIPHKATESFNYLLADWICDWVFVRRTQEQYVELFRKAVSALRIPVEFSVDRESTNEIFFATAKRLR